MIRDLSLTLRAILSQSGLPAELGAAQIAFDRPTDPFAPAQTTVDLFLYDIRENVVQRSNEPIVEHVSGEAIIRQPPLRVACSYLVTAWPSTTGEQQVLDEHRLLSQALAIFSRTPTIPSEFLQGSLAGQEPPLPLIAARADGLPNPPEFWSAVGNKLRPSLTVTATVAMDVFAPETAPIAITDTIRMAPAEATGPGPTSHRIGGRITDAQGEPVQEATVTLVERGLEAITDGDGRYRLGRIPAGTYTLRAQADSILSEVTVNVPAPAGSDYDVQLV
ncbi:MAG: DUF4255 domain-containing protein [bacterium]|nr:DUF4255 domain-containing protein [bacterium]